MPTLPVPRSTLPGRFLFVSHSLLDSGRRSSLGAVLLAILSGVAGAVEPPGLVVTIATDTVDAMDHETSLREAVAHAGTLGGIDTVTFDPALGGATILLTGGVPLTGDADGVVIDATALAGGLTLQSTGPSRIVLNTGNLTLRGLTLTGATLGAGAGGGAVYSNNLLELDRCTLTGNSAGFGGGAIFSDGTTTIRQCTLSGNSTAGIGAAVFVNSGTTMIENSTITGNTSGGDYSIHNNATLTLVHCTIAENTSSGSSGGIHNVAGRTLHLENCILGGGNTGSADVVNEGTVNYTGANLAQLAPSGGGTFNGPAPVLGSPMLEALGDFGGPTLTMPPQPGGPAIDAAVGSTLAGDQRGSARPVDGDTDGVATADLGAVEYSSTNANLAGLVFSDGTLSPAFGGGTLSYEVRVPESVTGITLTPTTEDPASTVTVNGTPVASGSPTGSTSLSFGPNLFEVVVTAQDSAYTTTYTVTVFRMRTVTTTADAGAGSLRQALLDASASGLEEVIGFAPSMAGQQILLVTALTVNTTSQVVIDGSDLPSEVVIYGGVEERIFTDPTGTLVVRGLGLWRSAYRGWGGAFSNTQGGTIICEGCVFLANYAFGGTVLYMENGSAEFRNCTFSQNHPGNTLYPGGLFRVEAGTLNIEHCTFDNHLCHEYGILYNVAGTATIRNSILFNTRSDRSGEIDIWNAGTLNIEGANIYDSTIANAGTLGGGGTTSNVDPQLWGLDFNGGPTRTCYPKVGSPVIDAAVGSSEVVDQRGAPRPVDGDLNGTAVPDIGAVEYGIRNPDLSALTTNVGTLSPGFDSSITNYTLAVHPAHPTITVTPTTPPTGAVILVNGVAVDSGTASDPIPVGGANPPIEIRVNSQDPFFSKIYTLTVVAASTDADLSGLALGGSGYTPSFSPVVFDYDATVPHETDSITVTPTVLNALAGITVNGAATTSGLPSSPVALEVGDNTIEVVVTAPGGSPANTYTVHVYRQGNPRLISLETDAGALEPAFDGDTTSYTILVPAPTGAITVTPAAAQGNASITVNGAAVASGAASDPIALSEGANTITIEVTVPEGPAVRSYAITVIRPFTVTTIADNGPGSLRQAMFSSRNNGVRDVIVFAPALDGETFGFAGDTMLVPDHLLIDASGLPSGVTLHGSLSSRMFEIYGSLELRGLTLTHAGTNETFGSGAIRNYGSLTCIDCTFHGNQAANGYGGVVDSSGTLLMQRCTLFGNSALYGGAIHASGPTWLEHCTLAGNTATFGGAISAFTPDLSLLHCTISANHAEDSGGGVFLNDVAAMTVESSIVSANSASVDAPDIRIGIQPQSILTVKKVNLIQSGLTGSVDTTHGSILIANPQLAPLGDYGGRTATMALTNGSPAIDGAFGSGSTLDQRGLPVVGAPDLGAYESGHPVTYQVYMLELLPSGASEAERAEGFDYDGDGQTNGEEWEALTDPTDPQSRFRIATFVRNESGFEVSLPTSVGRHYQILTSPTMTTGSWTPAGSGFAGTGGEVTRTVGPFPGQSRMFVQIVVTVPEWAD